MKLIARQKIWLVIVLVTNLLLWIIPSDVVEQIARDRQTMLGRYSRTHFYWIVGVAGISMVSFYVDWSTGRTYKRRWFQVLAILLFLTPSLFLVDFALRTPQSAHYDRTELAFHRPVESVFTDTFVDKPEAHRTYPNALPGYGSVECALRTDRRGYRNQTDLDSYDVVVLGDSFAEGSKVSDGHPWAVRLSVASGLSVYNLGMSSYDPLHYLESLETTGLSLSPRFVLCMVYEGNDFRSAKADSKRRSPSLSKRFKIYTKQSPILTALDAMFIETFGPINATGDLADTTVIDWLPLAIPDGPGAKYYAFKPKQLRDMFQGKEEFALDRHWLNPRGQIAEMDRTCQQAGCRLIVIFAPTKAHVMLPLVGDRLPAEGVRAFLALRYKKELPEPKEFLEALVERAEARESVVAEWCDRESIAFASVTEALRGAALDGRQVYYTYDQHWTAEGHQVVADAVHRFLSANFPPIDIVQSNNKE